MNPRVLAVESSLIRALHARKRRTSIDLGLGEPSLRPEIADFEAATRWVAEHGCRYTPNPGDPELRETIARWYGYPGLDAAANVCVTTGSEEAVYAAINALLDPASDELLVVEPLFAVYAKIAEVAGIALRRVEMPADDGFGFDPDRIAAAIGPRTRMVVICSPCNPTGRVIDRAAVGAISHALAARPGPPVYVLHDEVYRELLFVDDAGWFAAHHPQTVVVNSLSKSNALTGLRIGWAIAPADALTAITKVHAWATAAPSTFAQRVALEIFGARRVGAHLPWYREQRAGALAALRASGLRFVAPDGSFYAMVEVGGDSIAFAHALVDRADVIAIPGAIFGASAEGWLRVSWVTQLDAFAEGLRRIVAQRAESSLPV